MVKTVRSKWVKLVILKVAQVKKSVGTPGVEGIRRELLFPLSLVTPLYHIINADPIDASLYFVYMNKSVSSAENCPYLLLLDKYIIYINKLPSAGAPNSSGMEDETDWYNLFDT